jgi:hypothetical protein
MSPLEINGPRVVAEVFDNEVVVIHLERGNYYSLTGSATRIWPLLGCGLDARAIGARVAATLTAEERPAAEAAVLLFLQQLQAEELVRTGPGEGSPPALVDGHAFQPPQLERFTDMQELIALDPVHDVADAEGWPVQPPLVLPRAG